MIQYTEEQKLMIRKVCVETLKEFIRICDKYDLTYFVAFGTAIGTVRHQGFIPWDDDMDVVMPRRDYDRFVEISKDEMAPEFEIYSAAIQKCVQGFYLQMFKKGTLFMTPQNTKWKIHPGIKLDIFPYDCVPESKEERTTLYKKIRTLNQLYIIKNVKAPVFTEKGLKSRIMIALCYAVYYITKITGPSIDKIVDKYTSLMVVYEGKSSYRTMLDEINPDKWMVREDEIWPLQDGVFEGIKVKLPAKNHDILTRQYGDYMMPPPQEQQVGHNLAEIKFGD